MRLLALVFLSQWLTALQCQAEPSDSSGLTGTVWQLVKFEGSDGKVLTAGDRQQYTLAFHVDGTVSARIACNRGHGRWTSAGPGQLILGPMAMTRAMCPPDPLQDRLTRDWSAVRSYLIKDGHLLLSLMADGGIYEFEPMPAR